MSAGDKAETADEVVEARRAGDEMASIDHAMWDEARPVRIARYWSGAEAPTERHAEARLLWSEEALSVRFVCVQAEPLVTSATPQVAAKTLGLWDRDVCEIFIAPDVRRIERYFEFEAAPTGEWLDLCVRHTPAGRETDWEFESGMKTEARIDEGRIVVIMRVPWKAFGRAPEAGEEWRANLFRCVGRGPGRGYLAWRPTLTAEPNFHVPEAFGRLRFGG
jgi:alpha-galactosidase